MNTSPPPSPPDLGKKLVNPGTMVPTDLMAWKAKAALRALPARQAYAMALDADRARDRQLAVGYRLYWLSDVLLGTIDVPADPSGYAVIGRHGSCDVVLDDERAVSLRHVLVRAAALDDGFPVLSVMDLQTSAGFELSDGTRQRSIAATGALVFRIGTHSIVALPSSGRIDETLPVPVVERGELAPHRVVPTRLKEAPRPELMGPPPSRITLLPESVDLSRRRSVVPREPMVADRAGAAPERVAGEDYEIILEKPGQRAGVRLSAADLDHGVLIGRSEKCVDASLLALLGGTISRVHVLLIREKGSCHLYDVASLVGTFANGARVRFLPLPDDGASAHLASRGGVTLHWRAL
ncbi:hypothetical protein BH11MYX4_BH11MYX4_48700 [soil metagenome]